MLFLSWPLKAILVEAEGDGGWLGLVAQQAKRRQRAHSCDTVFLASKDVRYEINRRPGGDLSGPGF